jgi:hypothetical protein
VQQHETKKKLDRDAEIIEERKKQEYIQRDIETEKDRQRMQRDVTKREFEMTMKYKEFLTEN